MEGNIVLNKNIYKSIATVYEPVASTVYSLALAGGILYTGSENGILGQFGNLPGLSQYNIFFSGSGGSVKFMLATEDKLYSAHQDGKIRIWDRSNTNEHYHKLLATLPTIRDCLQSSLNADKYVQVRRHHKSLWIKHSDAVSSLAVDPNEGLLYSASWDKTVKVWRLSDLKCIESINAHHDAVNAMVLDSDRFLFTGSADGTVKVWKRIMAATIEGTSKKTKQKHDLITTLRVRLHRFSVNSIVVSRDGCFVYAGHSDGIIRYWMKGNCNELPVEMTYTGRLVGHRLAVLCMAVCGETMICSGSADRTIRVWRRVAGVHQHCCMAVVEGHRGPVKSIVATSSIDYLTENGCIIYSGGLDKTLKAWLIHIA